MSTLTTAMELAQCLKDNRQYWDSETGRTQWEAQRACLGPVCEELFGGHSLEMGMAGPLTTMCPIRHPLRWAPVLSMAETEQTLVCPPDALPLPDQCLDLTVLHHWLENVSNAHHTLQEAARVTADNGKLVIFGFHPFGVGQLSRHRPFRQPQIPWNGTWRTPAGLREWLAFVDFEIERVDYCCFRWPGGKAGPEFWETLGRRYNLPIGESYMIQARRQQQRASITPLRFNLKAPVRNTTQGATRTSSENHGRHASPSKRKDNNSE
ncbi:class I SAM-dependent methyltransferase [Halomonas sediminis]